ncbi:MAG: hypothetical protein CVV64_12540 [Candidatus Wallbacteria bacterium HGW-Wallbacteria-1]|jgi:multimeric flavodoxin WrbA|uniref:NADPH-dependent FMN reductase-like domain-containing protein n=1 Tax=Candidatus Wallbacteria bacterium HGW-Wallbacteria-1 TaxID=2013854 RepID=A0A2N1PNJ1_9BACT|nr:MAG: hypothetical protein CVV64_12540 [Candidatus Wallbacteria bacterium HGW-Wallbacteria-1]
MKVLIISGSPRKGGNSETLVNRITAPMMAGGAEVELFRVYDVKYQGCIACEKCSDSKDYCVLRDGFSPVYQKMQDADLVIFSSPIYFGRLTGPLKCLIDRFYAFFLRDFTCKLMEGKKFVAVTVSGAPTPQFANEMEFFRDWFVGMMKMDMVGALHWGDLSEKQDVERDNAALAEADKLGAELAASLA